MRSKKIILDPESLPVSGNGWDLFPIVILGGMFIFMPASFGAVEAWSQLITISLAATLTLYLAVRIVADREFRLAKTWLYLPMALFLVLVAIQSMPLPAGLARTLAPANLSTKEQLLGETFRPQDWVTISFYPNATTQHFRILLIGAAVFVTVACVFRHRLHIKALLTVIFLVGCAEAALALAQIISRSGSIYWTISVKEGVTTAGSFINYSNFSQFMNLSLGAGLALLLVRIEDERRREFDSGGWGSTARYYLEKNAWIGAGIILCALSILASMSRNGAISSLVAAAVVGLALYRRWSSNWRGWLVAALPAGVLVVLLISGFDILYERMSTLRENEAYNARWEMTSAAIRAWQHYPALGTGFGTHEMVFPLFEHSVMPSVAVHADNDYAQLLEETGIVGVVLVASFVLGVAVKAIRLAVRGRRLEAIAVYGLMFGLVAVGVHSSTDFGQRLPANLSLSAALCGLVVAISRREKRRTSPLVGAAQSIQRFFRQARIPLALLAFVALAILWTSVIRAGYAAYLAERYWSAAVAFEKSMENDRSKITDEDYIDLIASAEGAYQNEPSNVNYGYSLSLYRWESLSRTVDPETGHVLLHPDTIPFVARIADDLAVVRRICPTFGPPYALEGQIRRLVLNEPAGKELILTGARLAPYDAATCLVAGELALVDGNLDQAVPLLERAVSLQSGYYGEVIGLYLSKAKRPDLARQLAAQDHNRLNELATLLATIPAYRDQVDQVRSEAEQLLRARVADGEATAAEVAAVARVEQSRCKVESAIDLYRRALSQDYQQVGWRMELARTLATVGRLDDAIHEVKIVLRLRPRDGEATKLLEELVVRSENARAKTGT